MLALSVKYTQNFSSIGLYTADRALESLSVDAGNCYHLATLLAAVLRKNGFSARIAGYVDSGNDQSPLNHWWVEVLMDGRWVDYDACFVQSLLLRAVSRIMSKPVQNPVSEIVDFFENTRGQQPVTFVEDKKMRYNMTDKIIAAEFELPR